jgi:hypothetical protein
MNDPRAWNNIEVLGPDRTYDLGEGITVKVARVTPVPLENIQVLHERNLSQNKNLKPLANFGRCLGRQQSKLSLSPIPSKANKSLSKKPLKRQLIEKKESARVQIKRSTSPTTPTIVDFSISTRKTEQPAGNLFLTLGKENNPAPLRVHQKYPSTTREREIGQKPNLKKNLRQKSESQILHLLPHRSTASDFLDSGPRALPAWHSSAQPAPQHTAHFGMPPVQSVVDPDALAQDLTVQWQDLAIQCESLEIAALLQQRNLDDVSRRQKEAVLEALKSEERRLTKALFVINKVFSTDLDEESQVKCAQMVEMLQAKIEEVKATIYQSEKATMSLDKSSSFTQPEISNVEIWQDVKSLGSFMSQSLEKKKAIEQRFFQACTWFSELQFTAETVRDMSLRDGKLLQDVLQRIEDMETLLGHEQKTDASKFLDSGLVGRDIRQDAQVVFDSQLAKVMSEGFERLTTTIKTLKAALVTSAKTISEQAREIDSIDKEKVVDDLEMLVSENTNQLLSFIILLDKFNTGFAQNLQTTDFSINCIKLMGTMLQSLIPSLSPLYDTVVSSLFDESTFNSIQILQPLLEDIAEYSVKTLSTRLMADVTTYLHRPALQQPSEASQKALNLILTTGDNFMYESFEAEDLARMYHYALLQTDVLREKQKSYYKPMVDLQTSVFRKLAVFQCEDMDCSQFISEIEKLLAAGEAGQKLLTAEVEKLKEEFRTASEQNVSIQKDLKKALEEIRIVKALKNEHTSRGHSRDKSMSRDKTRGRSPGVHQRSSTSLAKNSDTSVNKKSKETIMYSLDEELEDEKYEKLQLTDQKKVETLRLNLMSFSPKSPFFKKLIKLLDSEFNLEHHSQDWIARAIDGLVVRKGPKLACGYSGPKKIDVIDIWKQMSSNKIIDLEKKGLSYRQMRFDTKLRCFVLFKQSKKAHKTAQWDKSPSELLHNYSVSVDEVPSFHIAYKKDPLGATWQT